MDHFRDSIRRHSVWRWPLYHCHNFYGLLGVSIHCTLECHSWVWLERLLSDHPEHLQSAIELQMETELVLELELKGVRMELRQSIRLKGTKQGNKVINRLAAKIEDNWEYFKSLWTAFISIEEGKGIDLYGYYVSVSCKDKHVTIQRGKSKNGSPESNRVMDKDDLGEWNTKDPDGAPFIELQKNDRPHAHLRGKDKNDIREVNMNDPEGAERGKQNTNLAKEINHRGMHMIDLGEIDKKDPENTDIREEITNDPRGGNLIGVEKKYIAEMNNIDMEGADLREENRNDPQDRKYYKEINSIDPEGSAFKDLHMSDHQDGNIIGVKKNDHREISKNGIEGADWTDSSKNDPQNSDIKGMDTNDPSAINKIDPESADLRKMNTNDPQDGHLRGVDKNDLGEVTNNDLEGAHFQELNTNDHQVGNRRGVDKNDLEEINKNNPQGADLGKLNNNYSQDGNLRRVNNNDPEGADLRKLNTNDPQNAHLRGMDTNDLKEIIKNKAEVSDFRERNTNYWIDNNNLREMKNNDPEWCEQPFTVQPSKKEQEWGFASLFSFIFAFLCLFGQASAADYFTVIGPDVPVVARAGMDALLFCSLSPIISALNMEIRWFRINPDSVLYVYQDGKENIDLKNSSYRGRTELVKDNISTGVVGLRIRNIQPSDEGTYACYFECPSYHNRAYFGLEVTAFGSDLVISIEKHHDGEIQLTCISTGWYPEPEVLWRKADGMNITSTSMSKDKDNAGLFNVETTVTLTSNEKVTCHLNSLPLKTNKSVTIFVSDMIVLKNSCCLSCGMVLLIVGLVLTVSGLIVAIIIWKRERLRECWRVVEHSTHDVDPVSPEMALTDQIND